ncbi:mitochondrial tRNA-specific 2-thiouridylase 1 isoform X1 [Ixodes scapularis]|uniref:mitochondrial tRNA-specific 2-thiouridylase 1 isoform X1 n=1 Tax=Ixodes scapularis TaxID=6945 RepID=UPI001AD67E00|nr:mitochondrial tRNA-specific 2-thiouridylase 1 isoform X1 [Ixodes scapularis]
MASRFRKVVCGMSGGVDSSVAAFLLRKSGYDVTGVFMRNWDPHDADSHCDLDADETDAKWVCDTLGIPFMMVDFVKPYWHNVFSPMLQEYQDGLTPNPDIMCNHVIKFGAFHRHAVKRFGADAVATGHYARIRNLPDGSVELLQGVDPVKDQSFFLSQVGQAALQRTLFPLGEATKGQVKALARSLGLHRVADKKESMGMCFIGKQDFQSFVEKYVEPKRGTFVDIETGKVVGSHSGKCFPPEKQGWHSRTTHNVFRGVRSKSGAFLSTSISGHDTVGQKLTRIPNSWPLKLPRTVRLESKLQRCWRQRDTFMTSGTFWDAIDTPESILGTVVKLWCSMICVDAGVHAWTLGQRCRLGGLRSAYFVARLCPITQQILVASGWDHPALRWREMRTGAPHWIRLPLVGGGGPPSARCLFKSQHLDPPVPCTVAEGPGGGLTVLLDHHKRAISPGQFAVFYGEDSQCFGSAKITELGPSLYEEQRSFHSTARSKG